MTLKHWEYVFQILTRLQGLEHLIINISTVFCSHGCCSLINELRDIAEDYPFPQPKLRVTVQRQRRGADSKHNAGEDDSEYDCEEIIADDKKPLLKLTFGRSSMGKRAFRPQ